MMRLCHKLWLRENLKAKSQYRYTVCVKGLLPTTCQTNSRHLNSNTHICLHTSMKADILDYVHVVVCIISCNQYIHDFSCLEIHLTVKGRGCSQVHTLQFTVYIQRSFQSISDRWLKWSSRLRLTTDKRSSIHVCTPVCVQANVCMGYRCESCVLAMLTHTVHGTE